MMCFAGMSIFLGYGQFLQVVYCRNLGRYNDDPNVIQWMLKATAVSADATSSLETPRRITPRSWQESELHFVKKVL